MRNVFLIFAFLSVATVSHAEPADHDTVTGERSRGGILDNLGKALDSAFGRSARDTFRALQAAGSAKLDSEGLPTIESLSKFIFDKLDRSERVVIPYIDQNAIRDVVEILHPKERKELGKEQIADVRQLVKSVLALRESAQSKLSADEKVNLDRRIRYVLSRLNDALLGVTPLDFSSVQKSLMALGRAAVPNFDDQRAKLVLEGTTLPAAASAPALTDEKKAPTPEDLMKDVIRGLYVLQPLPETLK